MTESEKGVGSMLEIAKQKADRIKELEKKNKRRLSKGLMPLPDDDEIADRKARHVKRERVVTVDGANALRMFEERRAAMLDGLDLEDDTEEESSGIDDTGANTNPSSGNESPEVKGGDLLKAQRDAAAARMVADLKNARIDHDGVWTGGQKLERGDDTQLPQTPDNVVNNSVNNPVEQPKETRPRRTVPGKALRTDEFLEFKDDLYNRLRESFAGLERTLSDLQGRVSEISVNPAVKSTEDKTESAQSQSEAFHELLERCVPVVFEVSGAKLSFNAITVFHASPCITVVSKIGSATITPRPGARLNLSYKMDGVKYTDDPVTYLGTRFELPMFGLAFIGFIRDREAAQLDAEAAQ